MCVQTLISLKISENTYENRGLYLYWTKIIVTEPRSLALTMYTYQMAKDRELVSLYKVIKNRIKEVTSFYS